MKKIITLVALAFLTLSNVSCSNDDNNDKEIPAVNNKLIGKWDLKTLSLKITADGEVVDTVENTPVEGIMRMQFDFKSDNTLTYHVEDMMEGTSQTMSGTYVKTETTIIVTFENVSQTFTVLNIQDTKLAIYNSQDGQVNGQNIKIETTYNFEKM